ncbi:hybrid sensor histidine kinase/response regulator transcription factor [Saccharicrinis aurantiacus]|uniref:hybrid sensor histidine kinase/response regulator transcription factor n=1 Tax=Saccharicrinis aurantiacus TaxID=1849719 RepID=UPI002491694C|nr:two-component regulator propeller domain-containing protein [Saccharicrinis aurantiacus]
MKKNQLPIILGFLWVILSSNISTNNIVIRQISPEGGYSSKSINSITQDKFGFIWMASYNGVIRYNSKDAQQFVYNPSYENSLPSNTINNVTCDKDNNIWVATNNGIAKFNRTTQNFEKVDYTYENGAIAQNVVQNIIIDSQDKIWVIDNMHFGYLNPNTQIFTRINLGPKNKPTYMHQDSNQNIWIGANDGKIYLVDTKNNTINFKKRTLHTKVNTIFEDEHTLWVAHFPKGYVRYSIDEDLNLKDISTGNIPTEILNSTVRKVLKDSKNRTWIGTYDGLYMIHNKQVTKLNTEKSIPLIHNSIYEIFEDNQGGIWIGTWSGGVAYIHQSDNNFTYYKHQDTPSSLSNNIISSFTESSHGNIYVGTEKGGLNLFDKNKGTFKPIKLLNNKNLDNVNVKSIAIDKYDGVWVGCAFNGLFYKSKYQKDFINYKRSSKEGLNISGRGALSLCPCDSGMWIGTTRSGLNYYSFKTKQISFKRDTPPFSIIEHQSIRSLFIDSRDNLWVCTFGGLYKIHLPLGRISSFTTTSTGKYRTKVNEFNYVNELSDGKIYTGTNSDGINIYDPQHDSIYSYHADGLLLNKDVYGIIESNNKDIWVTTNNGIVAVKSNKPRLFQANDGLQSNMFNPNAIYKDRDGILYFGGTNGFNTFNDKQINTNTRPPKILISEIKVNNTKVINPNQIDSYQYEGMSLSPGKNSLSVHFTADNYLLPKKNKFKYRLVNYVNEWTEASSVNTANFVNIPAGEYTFEIVSSNNDAVWNPRVTQIPFIIEQYWYKTNLAILLYFVLFMFTVGFFIRISISKSKFQRELSLEKITRENHDELNEMKLRFFTNISHEFRTPLTLITLPIRKLLKEPNLNPDQIQQLETVNRNTNRLLQLINQIMDIRKVEKGQAKIDLIEIDIVKLLKECSLDFQEEIKEKNINLNYTNTDDSILIEGDVAKLDKVIYNILSNAFKYLPENGTLEIHISKAHEISSTTIFQNQLSYGNCEAPDRVQISITDSGKGIDSEDMSKIFDRYQQGKKSNTKNSTGIGLSLCKEYTLMHNGQIIVQSTPGKGSKFTIVLPMKQKAQKVYYNSHNVIDNLKSWTPKAEDITTSTPTATNKKINILIVEDNNELRAYISELLETYYTIETATDGSEGLAVLNSKEIDIVISDVMMPIMDGFELCKTIKSQIETSHIPVILLTALSSNENTSLGLEHGADAYLSKPFDEKLLFSQVKNLLLQRIRLQKSYVKNFIAHKPIEVGEVDNYFLKKVNTIIEENITNEQFSVELLAEKIGISRSQLHRKMKQMTNMTNSDYIMMVRIRKASELLSKREHTIDEVAFMTGFNSHSYFSKCFKKIHSITPKEFVQNL